MTDSPPLVQVENAAKRFDNGLTAFENLSLEIATNSFTSILGPSGCGKSTLLRAIAGLTDTTNGTVLRNLSKKAVATDQIGFVFQESTLMPWAPLKKNVSLPLDLIGLPKDDIAARLSPVLDLVDLTGFEEAYPRELSGGMKMRASIARALITTPALLLMDEPFAALDEITREKLNGDLLRIWQQQKCSVVFVTHSVYESVFLSERIIVLSERPARIIADIAIDAAYPRDPEFRLSPQYAEYCRQVSAALRQGISAA